MPGSVPASKYLRSEENNVLFKKGAGVSGRYGRPCPSMGAENLTQVLCKTVNKQHLNCRVSPSDCE
ncbi:hypothetical protein LEMLEM_LOCUS15347, partial [Lemmus lemmus]